MMKMMQTGSISRKMADRHFAGDSMRTFLAQTSIMTIITTTMTTTTELGAIGA